MIKSQISRIIVSNIICYVSIRFSVLRENLYEDVLDYVNHDYYYEYIARNDSFWLAPQIDFRYETKARKVIVDFKFDALYSKSSYRASTSRASKKVNRKFVLVGGLPTLHRECYHTL